MVKNLPAKAGDMVSIPGSRRPSWRRKWQPTPVFLPGESPGQSVLAGYSPWGHKEPDTTEHTHAHTHTKRKRPQSSLSLFHVRTQQESSCLRARSSALSKTRPRWHPDLRNFVKINFGWLSHPACEFFCYGSPG